MTVEWVCALSAYIIQRASAGLCYAKAEGVMRTVRITNPYAIDLFIVLFCFPGRRNKVLVFGRGLSSIILSDKLCHPQYMADDVKCDALMDLFTPDVTLH